MLTKGIIKKLYTNESNYFKVYIPLLRKAVDDEKSAIIDATAIYISGITNNLKVGDIVFLDFEDDNFNKPVILGKLFTGKKDDEITTTLTSKTLKVLEKTQLPGDTIVNNITLDDIINMIKELDSRVTAQINNE